MSRTTHARFTAACFHDTVHSIRSFVACMLPIHLIVLSMRDCGCIYLFGSDYSLNHHHHGQEKDGVGAAAAVKRELEGERVLDVPNGGYREERRADASAANSARVAFINHVSE